MDLLVSEDKRRALYRTMVRIRAFENAAEIASQGGVSAYGQEAAGLVKVRGPLHLSTGQEAVPAGVCAHLNVTDYLTSTHRGHGHTLAKGADLTRMMCELFGKATGFNGGKGGSMHIADFSVGMLGANGVVAGGFGLVVGAALSAVQRKTDQVAVCFFGDGATNRGPFHENLNLAAIWNLPAIFVLENNQYASTTSTAENEQFAVGTPHLDVLRNTGCGEAPVAGRSALIHRQQSAAGTDESARRLDHRRFQQRWRHDGWPHIQLRISGRSSPCLSI